MRFQGLPLWLLIMLGLLYGAFAPESRHLTIANQRTVKAERVHQTPALRDVNLTTGRIVVPRGATGTR